MKSNNNRAVEEFKEPIPMKKGDPRVICNGLPIRADFRIISENNYQTLYTAYLRECERMVKANTKNSVLHIFSVIGRFFKWIFAKRCPNCLSKNTKIEVYNMTAGETGIQCYSCGKFWYS